MNFDEWWNEDYDDKDNPFEKDSFGYWAYARWCAAMHALRQELVQQNLSDSIRPKGKSIVKVWVDEINQTLEQDDPSFDRTASHMAGEYVDTAQQEPFALKVYRGEICYMSQDDDQSFGMWCPVNCDTDHGFPNETKFYTEPPNREWVGLTNDEIDNLNLSNKIKIKQLILLIETKLKEKNLCR